MQYLYIAVRGPAASQQWPNEWDKQTGALSKITTSSGIINYCKVAQRQDAWVYIHRTAKGYSRPIIIAKVKVSSVTGDTVHFKDWVALNYMPPRRFRGGKCYFDVPVDGGSKKAA